MFELEFPQEEPLDEGQQGGDGRSAPDCASFDNSLNLESEVEVGGYSRDLLQFALLTLGATKGGQTGCGSAITGLWGKESQPRYGR